MLNKWCPILLGVLIVAQSMNAATISDKELLDALIQLVYHKNQQVNEESTITINSTVPSPTTTVICCICSCDHDAQILDCSQRSLERLFQDVDWKNLPFDFNVTVAKFSYNNIEDLYPFPALQLKTLDLSHNKIAKLSFSTFRYLQQLETLDLSYNKLQAATLTSGVLERLNSSEFYQPLSSMKTLILTGNFIKTLHQDVFQQLVSLKELQIGNNPFHEIDWNTEEALNSLSNLENLDLSYTHIEDLPNFMLRSCKKLKSLNLKGNYFRQIPTELRFIKSLEILIMDENHLGEFIQDRSDIPQMAALKELHLSNMSSLQYVDLSESYNLRNLQKLYITNNSGLDTIHNGLGTLIALKELYLSNNGLTTLDGQFVRSLINITKIDIRNNPWFCCWTDNSWLSDPVITRLFFDNPTMAKEFVCDEPPLLRGTTMRDILTSQHDLRYCSDINTTHGGSTSIEDRNFEEAIKYIAFPIAIAVIVFLLAYIMYMRGWCGCCCKKNYETLDERT